MKRFLLFRGPAYYAAGGWLDFKGSFNTAEEARAHPKAEYDDDWSHVVDTETCEVVFKDGAAYT